MDNKNELIADNLGQLIFRIETNWISFQSPNSISKDYYRDSINRDIEQLKELKRKIESYDS